MQRYLSGCCARYTSIRTKARHTVYRVAFAWVSYADSAGTVLGGQSFLLHKLTQETQITVKGH